MNWKPTVGTRVVGMTHRGYYDLGTVIQTVENPGSRYVGVRWNDRPESDWEAVDYLDLTAAD